ncbi:hypothetical protein [Micromonospora sp. LOL_021]|uniref:hypothetical protein n=1 Tax=Micromonospora sp. LOL_021 TaxID=3345417 RepID=UPI003A8A027E
MIIDTLSDLDPQPFDALDPSIGTAGTHSRLLGLERDTRWTTRYSVVHDTEGIAAATPIYLCGASRWLDPAYDPAVWASGREASETWQPRRTVVLAGRADLRSSLHVAPRARTPWVLRALLQDAADVAGVQHVAIPYIFDHDRRFLNIYAGPALRWRQLGAEASFYPPFADLTRLPSKIRSVLKRDLAAIRRHEVVSRVDDWTNRRPEELEADVYLIAAHKARFGLPDHPELVALRMSHWTRVSHVQPLVFHARTAHIEGVLTALLWSNELELHELGLSGEPSRERQAVYAELVFHAPMRFAASHGLTRIRAGLEASTAKYVRGATLAPVFTAVTTMDALLDATRS